MDFGIPKLQIKFEVRTLAVVSLSWLGIVYACENLDKSFCNVRIYLFPNSVKGKGPTISRNILSNGFSEVLVISIGN